MKDLMLNVACVIGVGGFWLTAISLMWPIPLAGLARGVMVVFLVWLLTEGSQGQRVEHEWEQQQEEVE